MNKKHSLKKQTDRQNATRENQWARNPNDEQKEKKATVRFCFHTIVAPGVQPLLGEGFFGGGNQVE
jgi:hypothetical protein